jgi:hypothetical protein
MNTFRRSYVGRLALHEAHQPKLGYGGVHSVNLAKPSKQSRTPVCTVFCFVCPRGDPPFDRENDAKKSYVLYEQIKQELCQYPTCTADTERHGRLIVFHTKRYSLILR